MRWATQAQGLEKTGITSEVIRGIGKRFWVSEITADFSMYAGKTLATAKIQDRQYAKESLIVCDFTWPITYSLASFDHVGDPTLESQLYSAVTGKETDEEGLYRIGERIFNLQRPIHTREGRKGRAFDVQDEFNYKSPLKGDFGNPECLVPGKDGQPFSRKGMAADCGERVTTWIYSVMCV